MRVKWYYPVVPECGPDPSPMHRSDLAFALTGDVHRNTRALRQLSALSEAGLTVTLLCFPPTSIRTTLPDAVDPVYIPRPEGDGPRWFLAVHRRFATALANVRASLWHASDLYVLRAVRAAARRSDAPYTYDARELYAHVAATADRPLVSRFWSAFEAAPARGAAAVWTVSDAIADRLVQTHAISPRPVVQVNAPVAGAATPDSMLRSVAGVTDATPLFVHLGQMRAGRGGEALVRAVSSVPGAALVFLGYGPQRDALESLAAGLGTGDRIRFVDPVPPERIRPVIAAADVGVTLLEDTCLNHRFALPNKLFDYLAAGLPVLGSRLPEIDRVVTGQHAGLTADPDDPVDLAATVGRMARDTDARRHWSANALAAAETFDWAKASERFKTQVLELIA